MVDRNQVHEGMVVRGSSGEELGRVVSAMEDGFVFEEGFFLPAHHAARYEGVAEISGDTIQLSRQLEDSAQGERPPLLRHEGAVVWPSYGDEGGGGLP